MTEELTDGSVAVKSEVSPSFPSYTWRVRWQGRDRDVWVTVDVPRGARSITALKMTGERGVAKPVLTAAVVRDLIEGGADGYKDFKAGGGASRVELNLGRYEAQTIYHFYLFATFAGGDSEVSG